MELAAAGLSEQPFRTHGRPLRFVTFQGQADAADFLHATYEHPRGLGLFQGPSLSGKTTILEHFMESLGEDADVARVDGEASRSQPLLNEVLRQYGFDISFDSLNEALNMLKVFAQQQTTSHHAPLLVIENTHDLTPDALQALCRLADLRVRGESALRVVLASDRSMSCIVGAPAMEGIGRRVTGVFNLCPMEDYETLAYLQAKLVAAGCEDPQSVLPDETCYAVHEASGGWPGIVDRLVLLALASADTCPLLPEHIERPMIPPLTGRAGMQALDTVESMEGGARLYLTYNGKTLREVPFDRSRLMVGRSEHNDLPIISRFVSRHHAMFIRDGDTTVLMDLNSTNGTFVNSKRISNHVMVHDDVVMIGHHRLKFVDTRARQAATLAGSSFNDTVIMKSLDDLRRLLARENTQAIDVTVPDWPADESG